MPGLKIKFKKPSLKKVGKILKQTIKDEGDPVKRAKSDKIAQQFARSKRPDSVDMLKHIG